MNSLNDSLPTISFLILAFSILLVSQLFQLKRQQRKLNNKIKILDNYIIFKHKKLHGFVISSILISCFWFGDKLPFIFSIILIIMYFFFIMLP